MITADALAREIGCTLADIEDLDGTGHPITSDMMLQDNLANMLRREWSKRTGIDYAKAAK